MSVEIDVVMKKYFQNVLMTIVHDLNGGNETEMTAFVSKGSTFYHFRNKKHGACLISRLVFFFFLLKILKYRLRWKKNTYVLIDVRIVSLFSMYGGGVYFYRH